MATLIPRRRGLLKIKYLLKYKNYFSAAIPSGGWIDFFKPSFLKRNKL